LQDYASTATSMRRILFLSKVSPPRVVAAITLRKHFDDLEFQAFGNCYAHNKAKVAINFPKAEPLTTKKWVKITMVYGATNEYGARGIRIMQGAQSAFQYCELSWCETDDDFIQAIQLPGGVIMSPVEVTLAPLPLKVLQDRFYHQKPLMDRRVGPRTVDEERKTGTIGYSRSEFTYPVALIAPPIVFQKRKEETPNCSTAAGIAYTRTLWNTTIKGEKCHFPYDCGDLMSEPMDLLRCKASETPVKFFGAKKIGKDHPGHAGWFFEFLQTVSNAHILKRIDERRRIHPGSTRRNAARSSLQDFRNSPFVHNPLPASTRESRGAGDRRKKVGGSSSGAGSSSSSTTASTALDAKPGLQGGSFSETQESAIVFDPGEFLDFQTERLQVVLVTFSPEYGIASMIMIEAAVGSEVRVDFLVRHYQSAEGGRLKSYQTIVIFALVLAGIILLEKLAVMYYLEPEERRKDLGMFAVDLMLQVILPVTYFGMRWRALGNSADHLKHVVGNDGMAGIPWQDQNVELTEKIETFLHNLDLLEIEINLEEFFSAFYAIMATTQLFRLIYATKAHPRTSILVKTIIVGKYARLCTQTRARTYTGARACTNARTCVHR
jgi:hypothetical protein